MFVSTIIGQRTDDADSVRRELAVERLGQADDGELRRAVDAEPLHADQARHRRGVDDVAALLLRDEARHERLDAVHDAPEFTRIGVLPVVVRRARGDLAEERDAGVVADDVHGAVVGGSSSSARALHRGQVADVGADAVRGRAALASSSTARSSAASSMSARTSFAPRAANARAHGHADAAGAARDRPRRDRRRDPCARLHRQRAQATTPVRSPDGGHRRLVRAASIDCASDGASTARVLPAGLGVRRGARRST